MWKLFQAAVIIGFITSNAVSPWTPNPLVPFVLGLIAAELMTWGLTRLFDLFRRLRPVFVSNPAHDQVGDDCLCLRVSGGELGDLPKLANRIR